jgi:hypothetical protein
MDESAPDVNRSQFDRSPLRRSGLPAENGPASNGYAHNHLSAAPSRKTNEGGAKVWRAQVFEHP